MTKAISAVVSVPLSIVGSVGSMVGGVVGSVAAPLTPIVGSVANSQFGSALGAGLAGSLTGGGSLLSGMGMGTNSPMGAKSLPVIKQATFLNKLLNVYKLNQPSELLGNLNYTYDQTTGKRQLDYVAVLWKGTVVLLAVYGVYKLGKKKRWF